MYFSFFSFSKDVLVSTIDGMSPCTKYTIEVGAGPYIYRKSGEGMQLHEDLNLDEQEEEDNLLETINKIWSSQQGAFRSFATTMPVSVNTKI